MRKPFHKHERDPVGLARPKRPVMTCAHLSQGRSLAAPVIWGWWQALSSHSPVGMISLHASGRAIRCKR